MLLNARPYFYFRDSLVLILFFFQESHSNDKDVNFWKSQWGNEIWFSHGSEHSAGVSCLKNNFAGEVLTRTVMSMGTLFCYF